MYKVLSVLIVLSLFNLVSHAEDANELYTKAIAAKTIGERDELIEKSLEAFLKIENDNINSNKKNGYLFYNIGNCYFVLNQLGKSILYYEEALKLLPNDENIRLNLETALKKRVNALDYTIPASLRNVFFFHYELTDSIKVYLMLGSSLLIFVLILLIKVKDKLLFRVGVGLLLCIYLSLLGSVVYSYYSPLIKGVLNQASLVYKEPSEHYASVTKNPVGEGSRVKVLKIEKEWVLIQVGEGLMGYVKRSHLDVIL